MDSVKKRAGWLDDEAVDRYMELVIKRRSQQSLGGGAPSVGFLSAQFMTQLSEEESPSLEGWTTPSYNPYVRDLFLLPYRFTSSLHWILIVSVFFN